MDQFSTIWDPFSNVSHRVRPFAPKNEHAAKVDWRETSEAHIFKADVPGLQKKEVTVQVLDGKTLEISGEWKKEEVGVQLLDGKTSEISGELKKEEVQTGDTWHRVERSNGNFSRKFHLPDNSNVDQVHARMQDGVLTVEIPKVQPPKPRVRRIEIS